MEGENFVSLTGRVMYPTLKQVGEKNTSLFNGKLAIPTSNGSGKDQYVKISAWAAVAESISTVKDDQFVRIHGHIEERSYDGKCKHCGGADKKFWTSVVVDRFGLVE
jgi:hypothetical protein